MPPYENVTVTVAYKGKLWRTQDRVKFITPTPEGKTVIGLQHSASPLMVSNEYGASFKPGDVLKMYYLPWRGDRKGHLAAVVDNRGKTLYVSSMSLHPDPRWRDRTLARTEVTVETEQKGKPKGKKPKN